MCQSQYPTLIFASDLQFSTVPLLSYVWLFAIPWTAARQASLSITSSQSLLKLISIELVMPCNHLILCCPLLFLTSIFPNIRVFSSELVLRIRWPMYWSFKVIISPSNEYSGLISFRMDWLDLLAEQGTLKSLTSSFAITSCPGFGFSSSLLSSQSLVDISSSSPHHSWQTIGGFPL